MRKLIFLVAAIFCGWTEGQAQITTVSEMDASGSLNDTDLLYLDQISQTTKNTKLTLGVLDAHVIGLIPTATTSTLGIVMVDGSTITISDGVISAHSSYTLPTATQSLLGGVKIDGSTIVISGGIISAAGFSGSLSGDVTGTQAATVIGAIEGNSISSATATALGAGVGVSGGVAGIGTTQNFTGRETISSNAATSASPLSLTGTLSTNSTGRPILNLNSTGTTTAFGSGGTFVGITAPTTFIGDFLHFIDSDGTQIFSVDANGNVAMAGNITAYFGTFGGDGTGVYDLYGSSLINMISSAIYLNGSTITLSSGSTVDDSHGAVNVHLPPTDGTLIDANVASGGLAYFVGDGSGRLYLQNNSQINLSNGSAFYDQDGGSYPLPNTGGVGGTIFVPIDDGTTPTNPSSPAGWNHVQIGGSDAWIPYYR